MQSEQRIVKGLEQMLGNSQVVAILCNQFGDSGKGKFSEMFAHYWADIIVRGTGADNAGHTTVVDGVKRVYHLLPAGITQDKNGKVNILGNGMAINPIKLVAEIEKHVSYGESYNNLMISRDAIAIMPYHIDFDRIKFSSLQGGGVGSTGNGVTPAYGDKTSRRAIFMSDLFDKDKLVKKIEAVKPLYEWLINEEIHKFNTNIRCAESFSLGRELPPTKPTYKMDVDEIVESLTKPTEILRPLVRDTVLEVQQAHSQGKKILMEGAQGLFLSVEHGLHPYITSSDCSLNGTATGCGLSAREVDFPIGIVKFPFMTRVGGGPFVTELGGEAAEEYCARPGGNRLRDELTRFGVPFESDGDKTRYDKNHPIIVEMMHSEEPFLQGLGLRLLAGEFGATTGRPRRIGWTDAVLGRYASEINGPNIVFTKVDCLAGADRFNVCYEYDSGGQTSTDYHRNLEYMKGSKPIFRTYNGYDHSVNSVDSYDDFDESLRQGMQDYADFTGGIIRMVSNGEDRNKTVILD